MDKETKKLIETIDTFLQAFTVAESLVADFNNVASELRKALVEYGATLHEKTTDD